MRLSRIHLALLGTLLAALTRPLCLEGQSRPVPVAAATARRDSAAVADALSRFLKAFENLDWTSFRAAFSDSATVVHPAPEMAERVVGPRGIDSTFRVVFADIRAHATGGPPYHRLVPTNQRIQPLT